MNFLPLDRMWARIERARDISESEWFSDLLLLAEMVMKITTMGLVAAIEDDNNRHRYRQLHTLVRADGLGVWNDVLNDVLTGPASQYLASEARTEQLELTKKYRAGSWQHEAVIQLRTCLVEVYPTVDPLPTSVDARRWFQLLVLLRNKTKGHGAPTAASCARMAPELEQSTKLMCDNLYLYQRPWAFLHQSLSGKYRVTRLTEEAKPFEPMRSQPSAKVPDGVYIYFEKPTPVVLMKSDVDVSDFYLPNGGFNGKQYEALSYVTGKLVFEPADSYLAPVGELPSSETEGSSALDVQGDSFGNLPPYPTDYVQRAELEGQLYEVLRNDRHPVVTLVGRGGIGKTSLALTVLHKIAQEGHFEHLFWFSARDIDLLPDGPKLVKPHVLTEKDIAKEFVRLLQPPDPIAHGKEAVAYFTRALSAAPSSTGKPTLFVFDNFETVRSPLDLFNWIDTHIRLPNKVLITTRQREFKGDYPVDVTGMNRAEYSKLVDLISGRLGIRDLVTPRYQDELFEESDGHPYVVKILLGEVARAGRTPKVSRILAGRDDILDALFERTYAGLSPTSTRVFLTLCNWRSVVARLAIEAVLLRPENSRMDIDKAISELTQSSFVEITLVEDENEEFLAVPFVTRIFGKSKLGVSPMRSAIEADTELLRAFGVTQYTSIHRGTEAAVNNLFLYVQDKVTLSPIELDRYRPILEFVAGRYPPASLRLASLLEKSSRPEDATLAKDQLVRYLEYDPNQPWVWLKLANYYEQVGDIQAQINALVSMCLIPCIEFWRISTVANTLNNLLAIHHDVLESVEKRFVVQQLIEVMEQRVEEANPTDLSRLAWLCLRVRNEDKARRYTTMGLDIDPDNSHCRNLLQRLTS